MRTLLLTLALAAAVAAQVPVAPAPRAAKTATTAVTRSAPGAVGPDGKSVPASGPDGKPTASKPGKPGEAKVEPPKLTPRAEKLKALQFDRKPSGVLKAWAPEPKPDPAKPAAKVEPLDAEIAAYKKAVVLADWAKVKEYLLSLPDEEAVLAYRQTLAALKQPQNQQPGTPQGDEMPPEMRMMMMQGGNMQQYQERNSFGLGDVFGLAAAAPRAANPKLFPPRAAALGTMAAVAKAPAGLDKGHLADLGAILAQVVQNGTLPEVVLARFKGEVAKPTSPLTKREVAKLFTAANLAQYSGDFLPTPEQATAAKDGEALNLLARHYLARHVRGKAADTAELEKAWHAVQAVLAFPGGRPDEQEEALLRAVELAPRVTAALGQAWLDDSFTKTPDRGMEILAKVGTLVSTGLPTKPFTPDDRLNTLKLMRTAVDALVKASPEKAKGWEQPLTLLAAGWLKEAEFSRQYARGGGEPRMQQDRYGNIFYSAGGDEDDENPWMRQMYQNPNMPRPIAVAEVMKARPSDPWVAAVDPGFRPRLAGLLAQLHLKAGEEEQAFPLIEALAPAQPDQAKELVREFVQVWTRNHNPNTNRNRYRYQWYFYGMENRAEGIPLTRSKQERNLEDLAKWAARIRKLPVGEIDEEQLVGAFTACHSSAEVYKTAAVESVFGPLGGVKPKVIAGLAQQMRTNLAGLWRSDEEQQQKKTNRKKKDIEAEVLRGYAVARQTVADGLARHPGQWALLLADASLRHDEVNYRSDLNKTSDFSAQRQAALDRFAEACGSYAKVAAKLPEAEYTTQPFEQWLYASLGAVDLGSISEDKTFAAKEPAKIKAALDGLPGTEVADKHRAKFANNLFTRMSGAKPHVKFRYLKAGFDIAGDHPRASEAKKVFDYYKDLVKEIRLETEVDGSAKVGHGRPFGVFVNLAHTRDIERESGGFNRYLQNQNGGYFSYNYGRPTADYRDRFEQAAKEALKEQFEVISVTFQAENVTSRARPEFGWRYTPYAYLLLKPRGPQVDAVPQLRLDLDFLDTSGYVVLPVESPKLSIDATAAKPEPRPLTDLQVIQTLDERQADKGQLFLEVKAQSVGLLPDLEDLVGAVPAGFEVTKTDDQGLLVKKFAETPTGNAVLSERTWLLSLKGADGQAELPVSFTFPGVKPPTREKEGVVYQRYADADLASVPQTVSLEARYGTKRLAVGTRAFAVAGAVAGLGLLAVGLLGAALFLRAGTKTAAVVLPDPLTPFSVSRLLGDVRPAVPADRRPELDRDLEAVERGYFADAPGDRPDLRRVAEKWAAAAV